MKDRSQALNMTVGITVTFLLSAGGLVIIGIFNSWLQWDIFSPAVEKFLYAVFFSCIVLALLGVAITVVLGINEAVRGVRLLSHTIANESPESKRAPIGKYVVVAGTILAVVIVGFALANHYVLSQRHEVFKRIATEQFIVFSPKLAAELATIKSPPRDNVPKKIFEYINGLDSTSAFVTATLYVPDPADQDALWGYTAWRREYKPEDGFARFVPVKPFEKALAQAIKGKEESLNQIVSESPFEWYGIIKDSENRPLGVLRLDGNPNESYRDY